MQIRNYDNNSDKDQVIELWNKVFPITSPHHDPLTSINRKLAVNDNLFFIAESDDKKVIGTIMVGYDGHRGWIYSLAVNSDYRKKSIGSLLLKHAEKELLKLNCPKINLQILPSNKEVISFYIKNGFCVEERIHMGKKLY
jgi:ribosomal protein S18 acetylase RimI-like enzyme